MTTPPIRQRLSHRFSACQRSLRPPVSGIAAFCSLNMVTLCLACLLTATACRRSAPPAPSLPTAESQAADDTIKANLKITPAQTTAGGTIDIVLEVEASAPVQLPTPHLEVRGLDVIYLTPLSAGLNMSGHETWRFHWVTQSGAPQTLTGKTISIDYTTGTNKRSLTVPLPPITIRSIAESGSLPTTLPSVEGNDAL